MAKKKRGRRPLPTAAQRKRELRVKLTDAEYERMTAAARASGMSVSDWVRHAAGLAVSPTIVLPGASNDWECTPSLAKPPAGT